MEGFQLYLSYWPPIVGTLVFLLLGLWFWLMSSRAAEASPRQLSWVKHYREGGFPLRAEAIPAPKFSIPGAAAVFFGAALFALLYQCNAGWSLARSWTLFLHSRYAIMRILTAALGATAVWLLVRTLFGSRLTGAMAAVMFLTAPRTDYEHNCLLAMSLLFLLWYLRCEKTGFAAELLYLAGALCYSLTLALWPGLIWIAPFVIALHWYKLRWYLRNNRLRFGRAMLYGAAALVFWALFIVIAALMRRFLHSGFLLRELTGLLTPTRIRWACSELAAAIPDDILKAPRPSLLLNPIMNAPILCFGFWGLIRCLSQLRKRGSVRAFAILLVALVFGLTWLLTGYHVLVLPLLLGAAWLIRDAVTGRKIAEAVCFCMLAVLFHLFMAVGSWWLPMTTELRLRML